MGSLDIESEIVLEMTVRQLHLRQQGPMRLPSSIGGRHLNKDHNRQVSKFLQCRSSSNNDNNFALLRINSLGDKLHSKGKYKVSKGSSKGVNRGNLGQYKDNRTNPSRAGCMLLPKRMQMLRRVSWKVTI